MKNIISTTALSSILIAGVFIGVCGTVMTSAFAQSNVSSLKPTNEWSVNQIGQGAQSYCALSRSYDQGLVLTLGQSAKKEYSLAIDFQDAGLDTGKSYKVALQPGPGQVRAYQLRPASQRALVVRLGFDDGFFKSINDSKELKAQIDGQNYLFDLSDYAAGEAALNKCMTSLNGGAPVQVAEAPKVTTPILPKKAEDKVIPKEIVQPKPEILKPVKIARSSQTETVVADIKPPAFIKKAGTLDSAGAIETPPPIIVERASAVPVPAIEREAIEAVKAPVLESVAKVTSAPRKAVAVKQIIENAPVPAQKVAQGNLSNVTSRNAVSKVEPASKVSSNGVILPSSLRERPTLPSVVEAVPAASKVIMPEPEKVAAPLIPKPEIIKSKVIASPIAPPTVIVEKEEPEAIITPDPIEVVRKKTVERVPDKIKSAPVIPKPEVVASKQTAVTSLADVAKTEQAPKINQKTAATAPRVSKREQIIISNAPENIPRSKPRLWSQTVEKKQQDELVRIKEENKRLNEALSAQIKKPVTQVSPPAFVARAPQAEPEKIQSLKAQIAKLEAQVKAKPAMEPPVTEPFVSPEMTAEIEMLRAENKKLVASLGSQEKKMESFNALSPEAEKELEQMRQEVEKLRTDNERLAQERLKTNSQIDGARVDAGNKAFEKIREFETQLALAKEDNLSLSREIAAMRAAKADNVAGAGASSLASNDWDLEKATKRYNEAEREIRRLGMLLEQQRTGHRAEKVELEQMLFDPAVTDKQQRRRLVELETKLLAAEKQLEAMGRSRAQDRYDGSLARLDTASVTPSAPRNLIRAPAPEKLSTAISAPPAPVIREPLQPVIQARPTPIPAPVAVTQPQTVDLRNLLRQAGVQSSSISAAPNGGFRWQAGSIAGTAQIVPVQSGGSMDQFVKQYINTAKNSCKGDFASSETPRADASRRSYDIVCVGGNSDSASSVIFARKDQNLLAIAHSTNTDNLDLAIDLRDRLADKL